MFGKYSGTKNPNGHNCPMLFYFIFKLLSTDLILIYISIGLEKMPDYPKESRENIALAISDFCLQEIKQHNPQKVLYISNAKETQQHD